MSLEQIGPSVRAELEAVRERAAASSHAVHCCPRCGGLPCGCAGGWPSCEFEGCSEPAECYGSVGLTADDWAGYACGRHRSALPQLFEVLKRFDD